VGFRKLEVVTGSVSDHRATPLGVIPREGGESRTPRPIGSTTTVSKYWIARSSRAMTA